jgi:protein-disulfide isomerase
MTEIFPTPESAPEAKPVETSAALEVEEDETAEEIEEADESRGLPTPLWSMLIVLAFVIGLGAGYMIWAKPAQEQLAATEQRAALAEQKAAEQAAAQQAAAQQAAAQGAGGQAEAPQEVQRYPVPEDDDYVFGSADAPITIIEFSDYECPFCQRWHNEAWPQIKAKYGDQIRLVYRDFPLESIHPNATAAAEAANCAGEQDQYYQYNELLFSGQKPLELATYEAYAQVIGLDMDAFNTCVAERRYQQEVQDDLSFASEFGVRSTPTFFINGLAVVGAQPFEVFDQIISMELAGEIPE